MKKYKQYMDGVAVSDTFHQRLLNLEVPKKGTPAWTKYGAAAAALVLVLGIGAWGVGHGGWDAVAANFQPDAAESDFLYMGYPEIADAAQPEDAELGGPLGEPIPDIALAEPGDVVEPGMKTIGGYEVRQGDMVTYHILPYIEYGPPSGIAADYALAPPDGGLRDATRDDALALVGGEEALRTHLNWGECEFRGSVGFDAGGTVWMMSLWGEAEEFAFSLELSPGRLPPTCIALPEDAYTWTEIWGVKVAGIGKAGAYGDTERGVYMDVSREVEFIANGVGCRLKAYGTQDGAVEELVSRFVRWAILEGLDLSGISPEGAAPLSTDPNYSVGEPNWEDSVSDYDSDCPYCADGTPHTHPYNPQEAADPSYHAPPVGQALPGSGDGS